MYRTFCRENPPDGGSVAIDFGFYAAASWRFDRLDIGIVRTWGGNQPIGISTLGKRLNSRYVPLHK